MALPPIPNNNTPIVNNPFYWPENYYIQGQNGPLILGAGLEIRSGYLNVIGGGGGGGTGVGQIIGGPGIAVSPSGGTGTVTVTNTGVRSLTAGAGIILSGTANDITIRTTSSGGTVTNVTASAPITVLNGTTTPFISISAAVPDGAAGVTSLANNLTTNDPNKALTAAQGYALQQQLNSLVVSGGLILAGTFDASNGAVITPTSNGSSAVPPFIGGSGLPTPGPGNNNYYVIATKGTNPGVPYTPPGGGGPYVVTQGDWFLSNGTVWEFLNVGFNAPDATTTEKGIVRLATVGETQSATPVDTLAVTPLGAKSTYVPLSVYPAKGTLAVGTNTPNSPSTLSSTTPGIANGYVLTVDSACALGLKWAAPTGGGGGAGTVTFVGTGGGLAGGPITSSGSIDLVNRGIAPNTYTNPNITVNTYGVITGVSNGIAAIPCSCIVGCGSLITGTAANTPVALPLPAGSTGRVLTANLACPTGLEWAVISNASSTAPVSPSLGALWYDTSVDPDQLKAWDGTAWVPINSNSNPTAPTSPYLGQTWIDSSQTPPREYIWDGTSWVTTNDPASPTAPASPTLGQTWINTTQTPPQEYIWDGTSWEPTNSTAQPVAPTGPYLGQTWVNTSQTPPQEYLWNGTAWEPTNSTASPTAPIAPILGQTWVDTSQTPPQEYIWNGTAWEPTNSTASNTAPAAPILGQTWVDTSQSPPREYIWNGTTWQLTNLNANTVAPSSPALGETWVNTSLTPPQEFIWNGTTWGDANSISNSAAPTSPYLGQLWNDTSGAEPILKSWNGSSWVPYSVTIDGAAPASPTLGQLWNDTSGISPVLRTWDGTAWQAVGSGTVTNIATGTGLTGGPITSSGTICLADTTVSPGTYTYATISVDAQGRLTAASSNASPTGGTVTNVATGTGLTGGPIVSTGTIALSNTTVTAGAYTYGSFTVDAQGRLTAASNGTAPVTSIATGTGLTGGPITSTGTIALSNTTVTPGAYTNGSFTVDAQGRLTAASSGTAPVTAISVTAPLTIAGTTTPVLGICPGTTLTPGAVQLYDGVDSICTDLALTAAQGKALQDQITALTVSGTIELAGTVDASNGLVCSITSIGSACGYSVGSGLPAASVTTENTYVIVTNPGTFTPPGGSSTAATRGDWFLVSQITPGNYAWEFLNVGFDPPYALTNAAGVVCLSTPALALAGSDNLTALTPLAASGGFISKCCVTGLGSLIVGTAACAPAALPVGANGFALIACSACPCGLFWGNLSVSAATPTSAGILLGCTAASGCRTALGCNALNALTTGTGNVAVGWNAGCAVTAGCDNSLIGLCAGDSLTTGCSNVALGAFAACSAVSASSNVAIGASAGCLMTGGLNVLVGSGAGSNLTTGTCNLLLGPAVQAPSATGSCQLVLGFSATDNWLTGCSNKNIRPAAGLLDCANTAGTAGQVLLSTGTGICWASVPATSNATPTTAGTIKGCTNNANFNTMLGCNAGVVAAGNDGVFVGYNAGCAVTTGVRNVVVGSCSGQVITTGCNNVVVGALSGQCLVTGINNTFVGHAAGRNATGNDNTLIGEDAGITVTTGTLNVALGCSALGLFGGAPNTGSCNIAVGAASLYCVTSGSANTVVGNFAGCSITTGNQNQLFGIAAGDSLTTGCNNVLVGQIAGYSLVGASNSTFVGGGAGMCATCGNQTLVGHVAGASITTGAGNTALGYEALGFLGAVTPNTAGANVAVGECTLRAVTTGGQNTAVGYQAGKVVTTGFQNTLMGLCSGIALTTGCYNALFGNISGQFLTTGSRNAAFGGGAGQRLTTGDDNSFLGDLAGSGATTGCLNVAIGRQALATTNTGSNNIAIGACSLFNFNSAAGGNVGVGGSALFGLTAGIANTALGSGSGCAVTTGCFNVLLGQNSGKAITASNANVMVGANSGAIATGAGNVLVGDNVAGNLSTGNINVVIGSSVNVPVPTGNCQLAIGYCAGCCWLTGCSDRSIRPAAGILDCAGNSGLAGQVLSSTGSNGVVWSGGYGDTPVGAVTFFAANSVPAAWLVADGRQVSRSTYAALFAVIGTTYGAGNGSTTFNLPDLRGQFLRGWDAAGGTARGCDTGRAFGTSQGFALQQITGTIGPIAETFGCSAQPCAATVGNALYKSDFGPAAFWTPTSVDTSLAGTLCFNSALSVASACETRPMNVAMLPCIKWQVTTAPSSCGIPCACLTGKGALVTATAADTPVALPVGGNGLVLRACDACASGLYWATPPGSLFWRAIIFVNDCTVIGQCVEGWAFNYGNASGFSISGSSGGPGNSVITVPPGVWRVDFQGSPTMLNANCSNDIVVVRGDTGAAIPTFNRAILRGTTSSYAINGVIDSSSPTPIALQMFPGTGTAGSNTFHYCCFESVFFQSMI